MKNTLKSLTPETEKELRKLYSNIFNGKLALPTITESKFMSIIPQIQSILGGSLPQSKEVVEEMVNRFLMWELPKSVGSDICVTQQNYPLQRLGTMLLTASEARQMIEHILPPIKKGASL